MSNALIKKRPDNDVAIVGNEGGLPTVRLLSPETKLYEKVPVAHKVAIGASSV